MDRDLRQHLNILRKRWWIIALACIAGAALGALGVAGAKPVYRAEAKLSVGLERIELEDAPTTAISLSSARELLSTYAALITTRPVAQRAITRAGLPLAVGQVTSKLEATRITDTQLLSIVYRAENADLAARTVNAVAEAFEDQIEDTSGGRAPPTQIEILESAVPPTSAVSLNRTQNVLLAIVLALGLGVALAYALEALDVTVKSREEIEALGIPFMGTVPMLDNGREPKVEEDPQGPVGEAFRKIRTGIGFLAVEKPVQVILVTSPVAQEGKTTVALNLAVAYAQGGLRTLLVEADLRRPTLHWVFPVNEMRGLTTSIIGSVALDDAILATRVRNLWVLLAGAIPPNPVEILDSTEMVNTLARLRVSFDIVILDAPPLVPVADPATLARMSDGVLLVASAGGTHRKRLVEAAALLQKAGGRLLGTVLNRLKARDSEESYAYYYAHTHRPGVGTRPGRARGE